MADSHRTEAKSALDLLFGRKDGRKSMGLLVRDKTTTRRTLTFLCLQLEQPLRDFLCPIRGILG